MSKSPTDWKRFVSLCSDTDDKKTFLSLMDLFLTIEEKENIALRYSIIKELLEQKLSQREIAKKLHVSIAKITRGSNALKVTDTKILQYLKEKLE